jgi:hypothetical protein
MAHLKPATISIALQVAVGGLILASCATAPKIDGFAHSKRVSRQLLRDGERIAADPEQFLRETLRRCEGISAYAVDFRRQERRGLLVKSVQPTEHMRVLFRSRPFSVKMNMLDDHSDFTDTVYMKGWNNGRMRCRWRRAFLPGASPPVNDYDPSFAVTFGKSLSPITDFGIARLMRRVIDSLDKAKDMGLAPRIEYVGITSLEHTEHAVHHIRLGYVAATGFARRQVDVMIHSDTLLPAGCYLWLANDQLDASYLYSDFDLDVEVGDADFQIATPEP